jgi:hypothetical protein
MLLIRSISPNWRWLFIERPRKVAAILMLVSGVTHISQLFVYGTAGHVLGAAVFGVVYLALGLLLLGQSRVVLWLAVILPAIGGILGVLRFATVQANPFSVFHVAVDLVVVAICLYLLRPRSDRDKPCKKHDAVTL